MKVIRYNTFETNSSSTHSMIILPLEDYNKLNLGEFYLRNYWNETVITKEERNKIMLDHLKEQEWIFSSEGDDINITRYLEEHPWDIREFELPCTLEEWIGDELESDEINYLSPSNDELVIICKYGYN